MLQPAEEFGRAGGAWALRDGTAMPLGGGSDGPPVLLVPGERVLVLAVDLPLPTRRQRLDALPFAIEERTATPAGAAHLALGAAAGEGRWLAGVVDPEEMARWIAAAEAAEIGGAAIMPDALALPVPDTGWAAARDGGRVLVRASDGTGFAAPEARLEPLWEAAGRPALTETALEWRHPPALPLDLRQGAFAVARTAASPWRQAALVAGLGLAAHALIAAADVAALRTIAARWRSETAALVALARPGANLSDDMLAETATALVPTDAGGPPGAVLPLVSRASAALAGVPGAGVRRIGFSDGRLSLILSGDAPRGFAALAAAGLAPRRTGDAVVLGAAR